jgi:hypothetical protein
MIDDRRGSKRIPFRGKVKYGSSDPNLGGYSFNLSEGGIGIKAYRAFPPQSKITIFLYMGDETLRLEGVVKWVSPTLPGTRSSMGIKFTSRTDGIKSVYQQRMNRMTAENDLSNVA